MTDQEQTIEENRQMIHDLAARVKRLESGGGSGATSCCEGREAGKQDLRKGEAGRTCPVAPGEAKELLLTIAGYFIGEAGRQVGLQKISEWYGSLEEYRQHRDLAERYEAAADNLMELLALVPKPDSEARNERSGRRNTPAKSPEGSASAPCSSP